jgi:MutS domain V
MGEGPGEEYRRRLATCAVALASLERRHRRLARARLAVFAVGVLVAWLAFDRDALSPGWVAVPALAFAALVIVHLRVADARDRSAVAVRLYEDGLARVEDRWVGLGATGEALREAGHPHADDLDLFGRGSLYERLARVWTRAGERTLASWLLAPAPPDVVLERQAAVGELAPRLDLREDLAVAASEPAVAIDSDRLERWGGGVARGPSRRAAAAAVLGSSLTLVSVVVGVALDLGVTPLIGAVLVQLVVELSQRGHVTAALAGIDRSARDLERLSRLLSRLEVEPFAAPALRSLAGRLGAGPERASRAIHGLRRRVDLLDSARNFLFAPIALWLSWRLHLARSIDLWRCTHGAQVASWIAAVGEVEALSSLAAYAFECPEDRFPEMAAADRPVFEAEGLAHPLLPEATAVRNDVHLGGSTRVLVVSGSNMSGKSTLLRAVGTNAVLGLMGAPVRARRLRLSVTSIGASIRVTDSLLEGSSRFHAELTRLKQIVDLAAARPLLFLLDEILHGTNSHDRRIGAEAVVRALLERGAIGLVTTHDLALAEIAVPGSGVANVHFVDHLEDGRMRFDFKMRAGVVARSNALALMRAVGLDVGPPSG